jgi:two-component system cell cycle sensor histidine kinase/response regulator CckA
MNHGNKSKDDLQPDKSEIEIIYNAISDYITVIDRDFRIASYNRAVEKQFGKDLKGKLCYEVYQGRKEICPACAVKKSIASGKTEYTFQPATAVSKAVDIYAFPILDEKGEVKAVVEHGREAAQRILLENALVKSEENLRKAEKIGRLGYWEWNIRTNELLWSDEVYHLYGLPLKGKPSYGMVVQTLAPECRVRFLMAVEDALRHGAPFEGEYRIIGLDGREHYTHMIGEVIRDGEGEPVSLFGIAQDITERKLAELALKSREKQLAESQRIAHIGSWEHNLKTNQVFWSDELFRVLGLDPEKDPADFNVFFGMIHPDDQPRLRKAIDETLRDKTPFSIEYRFIHKDGRTRIIHAQAELIRDDEGDRVILSGTGQDVTERKQAEEKIRQSEQLIRSILDTVDEGFIVIDRDFRILSVNNAFCRQTGTCDEDVIGRHCYEISHRIRRPCYEEGEDCAVRHAFQTGEPHSSLHRHKDAKGSILFVETKAFPIKDGQGNITSVIETLNNITEKHLLEEERLKTQKLDAIGTLAGGIAHDFNNMLQGIFGYIAMAKRTISDKDRSLAMLELAEQALHMSVNLTTQLLTFSKGGKPARKTILLAPVIENSVRFALSGSNIDYRIKVDEGLWAVRADEGQIGQVIQNIVINAEQAMPLGGMIHITAKNARLTKKGRPRSLKEGKYVVTTVQDSGIGISEDFLPRIFDPYFTTKKKGSGLGLATSYSIVRNHGGFIDVASEAGKGASFSIYLPAVEMEKEMKEAPAAPSVARRGRILVMDDEELIRSIALELLKTLEHEVELAERGEEAIEKYLAAWKSGKPFDAVILDLTVRGGMGGKEAIERLHAIDPDIRAVVSSGYSDDAVVADYSKYGFKARLTKPYELEELRDIMNQVLGGKG